MYKCSLLIYISQRVKHGRGREYGHIYETVQLTKTMIKWKIMGPYSQHFIFFLTYERSK